MSALAGRWNFDGRPGAEAACKRMLAAQALYGPHDERSWSDGSIAIGRRLYRTLPEDRFDRQPLLSAGGALALVADVRIDNREELSLALDLAGRDATELCDAALLLAALERWSEGAVDRVAGDFAFALWNARARRLMLGRDISGQRPLHYHRGRNFFAFASMPKGLHALEDIPYAADEQAIAEFVALLPEGDGQSFFKDIGAVGPAQLVTVTADGLSARRYWSPSRAGLARPAGEDHAEGLRHHLDQATKSRLRGAEGAVAAQLSAGFDSAAVTATAARLLAPQGGKVVAFTAVPRENFLADAARDRLPDEGPLAAATAALYPNVEHHLIRAGKRSPLEQLDRNFYLFDRPMLNLCNWTWTSAILAAAQERHLSVMLTGQMGNVTLSYDGLEWLPELLGAGRLARLGQVGSALVAQRYLRWRGVIGHSLGAYLPAWLWSGINRLRGRELSLFEYTAIRPACLRAMQLQARAGERGLDLAQRPRRNGFASRLWVLQGLNLGNYNKGLLAGWGVDQRDPTADKRLVEFCLGVPMQAYLAGGEPRALAKSALADRLPQAVLNERRKGLQGADWHEGLTAARGEVDAELRRLAEFAPAARTLDLERMLSMVDNWPESGWSKRRVSLGYRYALLRGLSAGHFLRKAGGANL